MPDRRPAVRAPRAPREPRTRTLHGDTVVDDFAWMSDREDPRLRGYLEAENAYAAAMTAASKPLADEIFGEIKARTKETDLSVPVRHGGWWYYSRTIEGEQYAVQGRVSVLESPERPEVGEGAAPALEQVILDENAEAAGHEFFGLGAADVSPDGRLLAYAIDVTGDERFDLRVRVIDSGEVIDDTVRRVGYGVAWSFDGSHLFYTRLDDAWRPNEVWRHEIGRPADQDVLVLREDDERFSLGVGSSRDDRWVVIGIGSRTSTEYHLISAREPTQPARVVAPRAAGVEYDIEVLGDRALIVHNRDRVNFELAGAQIHGGGVTEWESLDVTTESEYLTGVDLFETFAALSLRVDGQTSVRILPRESLQDNGFGQSWDIELGEALRSVGVGDNPEADTNVLQIHHESMVTPATVYDYDLAARELTVLKRREVRGGYDPADYVQSLEWASAQDGTRIPLAVVRHRATPLDGTAPGVLYGYGAYGLSMDPSFSVARLSWLDRGVVFADAMVRGGSEMGRAWYDAGKLEHKQHTFTDFVDCARHLVDQGFVAPDRLAGKGGSAGGLLIGAVANQAPGVFRALHLQVPFVDALTSMLDDSLPLTTGEYEEWGDPGGSLEAYAWMRAYSPYDNLGPQAYPALLVTTNIHDTRVLVTEPAKYVARLREVATNDPVTAPILFRTEMRGGHLGNSGRYDAWRETAWELAVLLDLVGPRP